MAVIRHQRTTRQRLAAAPAGYAPTDPPAGRRPAPAGQPATAGPLPRRVKPLPSARPAAAPTAQLSRYQRRHSATETRSALATGRPDPAAAAAGTVTEWSGAAGRATAATGQPAGHAQCGTGRCR